MTDIQKYVRDWFALLAYAQQEKYFDPTVFKQKHDILATVYKRMDYVEQGEVAHLLDVRASS